MFPRTSWFNFNDKLESITKTGLACTDFYKQSRKYRTMLHENQHENTHSLNYILLTTKSHNYHSWLARNVKHRMVIAMLANCKGTVQREKLEILIFSLLSSSMDCLKIHLLYFVSVFVFLHFWSKITIGNFYTFCMENFGICSVLYYRL